jgi:phosphate starvation-inducible protein PhoH
MPRIQKHLSKKQKRIKALNEKEEKVTQEVKLPSVKLKTVNPITIRQKKTFDSFYNDNHLFLYGVAGTGKSFIAMYLALEQILSGLSVCDKLIIIRSAVQTRDLGFLPGNSKEKMQEYEKPYDAICAKIFDRPDAYKTLRSKHIIEFESTSFLRSLTFDDAIMFVDECQNMTAHELDTIITRAGRNTKIIFSGDVRQVDLQKRKEHSGIVDFIKIIKGMNLFSFVEFGIEDVVRGPLVKQYMKTRYKLEDEGVIERL